MTRRSLRHVATPETLCVLHGDICGMCRHMGSIGALVEHTNCLLTTTGALPAEANKLKIILHWK